MQPSRAEGFFTDPPQASSEAADDLAAVCGIAYAGYLLMRCGSVESDEVAAPLLCSSATGTPV